MTLESGQVQAMSGTANSAIANATYRTADTLVIDGTAGDSVNLKGGWVDSTVDTTVTGLSGSFSVYHHAASSSYAVIADAITTQLQS